MEKEDDDVMKKSDFTLTDVGTCPGMRQNADKQIQILSEEIKGPKTNAPEQALDGFIRSNKIEKQQVIHHANMNNIF
mgnify:CR=1 FL=1